LLNVGFFVLSNTIGRYLYSVFKTVKRAGLKTEGKF